MKSLALAVLTWTILFGCTVSRSEFSTDGPLLGKPLSSPARTAEATPKWKPAVFRGLVFGSSDKNALLRSLGPPSQITDLTDVGSPDDEVYEYESIFSTDDILRIFLDKKTGTITYGEIRPLNMSLED